MPTPFHNAFFSRPVIADIRTSLRSTTTTAHASPVLPFITIARQAGAGGIALAEQLTTRLNADLTVDAASENFRAWRYYDKQLIEKVASDYGLPKSLVAMLPERPHSLVEDLAEGIRMSGSRPSDESVYHKLTATIRALCSMGHAIIVGRGGAFCTHDLPAGFHVQLIAPKSDRIRRTAEIYHISESLAARKVEEIDSNREAFYRRFWPDAARSLDHFTLTVNTAAVSTSQLADMIARLVGVKPPAHHASS